MSHRGDVIPGDMNSNNHPHRERILALSQRLEHLQSTLELESSKRFDTLEEKLGAINVRTDEVYAEEESLTRKIFDGIHQVEQYIEEERRDREATASKHTQKVRSHEQDLLHELESVSEGRKESELWVKRILDDATAALRTEFAKEMRLLDEARKEFVSITSKVLPRLGEKLNQLKLQRGAMEMRLSKKREEHINHLKMSILEEKKLREELEEAILRMLSDIAEQLQRELENEKRERDSTEESLISVLEDTCSKLQIM